jgi:hypothetical protein
MNTQGHIPDAKARKPDARVVSIHGAIYNVMQSKNKRYVIIAAAWELRNTPRCLGDG